ncbi:arylamine N-acetyltransferase [Solidesulfovibrio sp.]|uniref:arylamine N-acetyltransferase family protein n=1 Tax=Solidesulfovibrio sp. TaxID=2910990 RepID=UPI002B21992F|nr:arylamine N-acetyltransferase [Solidesulfovibrio sp.]MEA4856145.1 arylamine N-acetyltransferase [Solidesulfovibrio sp.]
MGGLYLGDDRFTPVDLDAYCGRLGYDGPREPSLAVLRELHRRHPAAIPFEAVDVFLGRDVAITPAALDAKLLASSGRGGYCFEQNTLFLRALLAMGFAARPLLARSRWRRPSHERVARTHMVVGVRLADGDWLADVGFGACMLTAPLRLGARGAQDTRHEPARLVPANGELRLERLLNGAWTPIFDLSPAPQEFVDIAAANWLIANHPASSFRRHLVVSRTRDDLRHVLVDTRLTVRRAGAAAEHTRLGAGQLEACLRETFGLAVEDRWRPALVALASCPPRD